MNGWQSYGMFNSAPGVGAQVLYRPNGSVSLLSNNYWGRDWMGIPERRRVHTDNSLQVKFRDAPASPLDKAAMSLTVDLGCESGGGVVCGGPGDDTFAVAAGITAEVVGGGGFDTLVVTTTPAHDFVYAMTDAVVTTSDGSSGATTSARAVSARFFASVFSFPRSRHPSSSLTGWASGGNSPKLTFIGW